MSRLGLILLMSLATAGAYAQNTGGTTMSTDPAKVAAVEKHAQELKARQSKETTSKPAATHTKTPKAKTKANTKAKAKTKTPATNKSSTAKPAAAPKS